MIYHVSRHSHTAHHRKAMSSAPSCKLCLCAFVSHNPQVGCQGTQEALQYKRLHCMLGSILR